MNFSLKWLGLLAAGTASLLGAPAPISEAEALAPPTPQRVTAILAAARQAGWAAQAVPLRTAAETAYKRGKLPAAEAWFQVFRWAQVLGQSEHVFVQQWIAALSAAHLGHANMGRNITARAQPISSVLTYEVQSWLVSNLAFSTEFFGLLTPVDHLPRVFEILNELYRRDPAKFKEYPSLALAIALVYDVPPPPNWPHPQVSAHALPRAFGDPIEAFAWWVDQDKKGRLYHKISRLGADELKFVVDTVAPFSELAWAQQISNYPLSHLASAYTMVRYRQDRMKRENALWTETSYKLVDILGKGGICVDQAYFAAQVGKARGVPTLIFLGRGNDARHAWFGYLDGKRKWKLDAGRFAEQRFVTGFARDPQTWREFSDHELKFLSERFHDKPSFRQSVVHTNFAAIFLDQRDAPSAAVAARRAVTLEKRNRAGWETLLAAARMETKDEITMEGLLREAAQAFQRYPDLEAAYLSRLADSLRARGLTSEAEDEVRKIALKNQSARGDLSVQQARNTLLRALATEPLAEQIKAYNSVVDAYGRGAGIAFFDGVVTPFVGHLSSLGEKAEALRALDRASGVLRIEPRSQLAEDLKTWRKMVSEGKQGVAAPP